MPVTIKNKCKELLRLLRPYQWIKNSMVFLPVIFSGKFLDIKSWESTMLAAVCFCLISSSIYCLNDVKDCKSDSLDPKKRHRPVAAGAVSIPEALALCAVTAILSAFLSIMTLPTGCTVILATYFALNILYCIWLKHVMLVDVFILATGFVLRVVMGGWAADIWISQWIVIMTFLLALFLAMSKRRHEVAMVENSEKQEGRKSVSGYTLPFLNSALSMLGAVLVIGYVMYTIQPKYGKGPESEYLYITGLPVLFGILRYLQLTIVENRSGDPTKVISNDVPLLTIAAIWIISFILIIDL